MDKHTAPKFNVGQVVKFSVPQDESEGRCRYVVEEYRASRPEIGDTRPDRVLVRYVCDMALAPTYVYDASELVEA